MSATNTAVTPQASAPAPAGPCGDDDCGIRDVLDRLGDRWTVLVIVELSKGVRRFRELERAIPGISQRMLTLTTKRLCRDGLVERNAYPTIPPQVDYRLTETGRSLAGAVSALADWSRAHKDPIAAARARWDAEHSGEL
ncbi:helix-turn-helix domain-containing protein [Actinocorallia sp. B10E7]|uniref:winged helix-turn-helix transcriptional regulator n=1 Tax=Actinocorallia sp. B10E7 TaxID=3153558 RepID=UPI00325F3511